MAKTIDLKIKIDQSGNAKSGIAAIASGVGKLGTIAAGVATGGLLLAAGGVVALGKGLFDSVGAAMEAQEGQAQLAAVLKSTQGASGMTAESINALASSLQDVTMFEDDAILAGQNMLLTFTNIGKDVFPAATETILDMATAMGTDTTSAAMQLGKALNDPVAGIGALSRVGVTFSEEQKKTIAALVEMGDTAGAQKIILAELSKEFGGSAVAAGETLPGKLAILKNTFGDIQETIGAAFLPALSSIADAFSSGLKSEFIQNALAGLVSFITDTVVPGFDTIVMQVGAMIAAFQDGGLLAAFAVFEDGSSRVGALAEVFGLSEEAGMALGQTVNDIAQFVADAQVIWAEWSAHLNETTGPAMVLIQDALDRIAVATGGSTEKFSLSKTLLDLFEKTLNAVTIAIQLTALGFQAAAKAVEKISEAVRIAKGLGEQIGTIYTLSMESIKRGIDSVIRGWDRLKAAAKRAIDAIPSWLRPGSPTPFEIGLRGIASAAKGVAGALPQAFNVAGPAPTLAGAGAAAAGIGAGGPQIIVQYSPVVSTASQIELERNLIPLIVDGLRKAGVKVG